MNISAASLVRPLGLDHESASRLPFDELRTALESADRIEAARNTLTAYGVLSIPMSAETERLLQSHLEASGDWRVKHYMHIEYRELGSEPFAATVKSFAETLVQAVARPGEGPLALTAQEFEIRQPDFYPAEQWHQDSPPALLTVLATIRGEPTEYLPPQVADKRFAWDTPSTHRFSQRQDVDPSEVKYLPAGMFHVFVNPSLPSDVPKLVHRAPPAEPGRAFLMARWKPERPGADERTAPSMRPGEASVDSGQGSELRAAALRAALPRQSRLESL